MHHYINANNSELWDVILDGPYVSMKQVKDRSLTTFVVKTKKDFTEIDRKENDKNYKAKKILVCGIGANEYKKNLSM